MQTCNTKKEIALNSVRLGIVCPMANERESAEHFINEVFSYCTGFRSVMLFAVLDRHSTDGTLSLLMGMSKKDSRIRVVWAPENRCVVDAYLRGYGEALNERSDWILEMDAGFSHQPHDIPKYFTKMAKGYDCVFGSRFCKGGSYTDRPFMRYFVSYAGSLLINLMLGTKLSDMTSGFELFTFDALEHVMKRGVRARGHFFQTEIKVHCRDRNVAEVPIHYRNPSAGLKLSVIVDAFKNLFRLSLARMIEKRESSQKEGVRLEQSTS